MPRRIVLAVILAGSVVIPAAAQTLFGRVSGTVADPSGAVVPGAKVTVRATETQATRVVTTDDKGFYVVENLPVGPYAVAVDQPGFKRATVSGLELVADGHVTADFKLQVGEATQVVEVVGVNTETLNTVSGEVAHVVDRQQIDNLALNGGGYTELLTLVPGTTVTNPDQFGTLTSLSATNQVVNGHRSNQNNLTVDGVGNLDAGSNGSLINNVSPDLIQEVKIQTSNFSAEYGRSTGASFNIVTKNGTNNFHGGAFEYLRNDLLDARSFFATDKTALRYNYFGYYLGGPIKKDKLFFFVGQNWRRIRQASSPTRRTVPSTAELQGIFPSNHVIYSPGTKTPLPNNTIPASLIGPDGRAIADVYKSAIAQAAIYTDSATSNNATYEVPNPLDYRQDMGRLNYRVNDNHTLFGRWIDDFNSIYLPFGSSSATSTSYLPVDPQIRDRPGKSFMLSETWVITPAMVNEAHAGASWNSQHYWNQGNNWQRTTHGFAFQRVFNSFGPYVNGVPDVSVSSFAGWQGPEHALIAPTTQIEIGDTISIVHGHHSIRTGVLIMRNRKDQNGRSAYDGNIAFNTSGNPNTANYALADALIGNFQTYTEAAYDPMGHYRYTEPAAFVDDSWKVSRGLTLNLGLRYEYMMAMYSAVDNLAEFVPSLFNPAQAVKVDSSGNLVPGVGNIYNGLIRVANGINPSQAYLVPNATDPAVLAVPSGAPRGLYPSPSTWQPRVGFAYALKEKTVLRGGFGMFYDRLQGNPTFYTLNNPPYVGSAQYEYSNLANIRSGLTINVPWGTIQTIDPKLKTPYSEQFSLSVQRELPGRVLAEATYVGTLSRHLLDEPDINQPSWATLASVPSTTNSLLIRPYQGYAAIQMFQGRCTSNYHALQVHAARRRGRLMFTGGYTFSKVLGDASSDTDHNGNYDNVKLFYGPLDFDVRHVFVGTAIYDLPRLKSHSQFFRQPFGGWQINGISHLQSGFHQTVTGAASPVTGRLADYVGGPTLLPNPGPNGWYNRAAFATAPYNRPGTSGAGTVVGPGLQLFNISVSKSFYVRERANLRFRADFINAFNHTNFQNPNVDRTSSNYGTISSTYAPRNIQMGLVLRF